jgi:hypothetical protein
MEGADMGESPASGFSLSDLLFAAGARMTADLKQKLVSHPGELGNEREAIVRGFLTSYLPRRFDVSHGFIFDSSGRISKQLDVIISNAFASPRFDTVGGTRHFPCEAVVAVGQVRSSVKSRAELVAALDNLESAKLLDRSAKGKACDRVYGEELDPVNNYLHQIFTFLFITGESLTPSVVQEEIFQYIDSRPPHLWPNVVIAPDRYLITFCCQDGVCANTMHALGLARQDAEDSPGLLMRFYLLLGGAIEAARTSGLPYWEYLGNANSWQAEVWHSTSSSPPPLLSSVTSYGITGQRRVEE